MKTLFLKIPWLPLLLAGMLTGNEARAQDPYPYVPIPYNKMEWNVFHGGLVWEFINQTAFPSHFLWGKTYRYTFLDTVEMDGLIYHKLGYLGDKYLQSDWLIRQDSASRRVFYRTGYDSQYGNPAQIYDFSKNAGEITSAHSMVGGAYQAYVDSVQYIELGGVHRKALYLHNLSGSTTYFDCWIEGIGSIYGPVFPNSGLNTDLDESEVQCVHLNKVKIYQSPRFEGCVDSIWSPAGIAQVLQKQNEWGVFPNPVIKQAYFHFPFSEISFGELKLIDAEGSIIFTSNNYETIKSFDFSTLSAGLYCIELKNTKSSFPFRKKFIKLND